MLCVPIKKVGEPTDQTTRRKTVKFACGVSHSFEHTENLGLLHQLDFIPSLCSHCGLIQSPDSEGANSRMINNRHMARTLHKYINTPVHIQALKAHRGISDRTHRAPPPSEKKQLSGNK